MTPQQIKEHLDRLRLRTRRIAAPAAVGLALGLAPGCAGEPDFGDDACWDGRDNDHDGDTDCEDEDCWEAALCSVAMYGVFFED